MTGFVVLVMSSCHDNSFQQLGDLSFLLKCNFSIEKIPFKLAKFHKQALMAWTLRPTNITFHRR